MGVVRNSNCKTEEIRFNAWRTLVPTFTHVSLV